MASLFDRLGYNFVPTQNNSIVTLSDQTVEHLNNVPQLLSDWQKEDLVNNDVGGYQKNPVSNVIIFIRNTSNAIYNLTNTVIGSSPAINTVFTSITTNTANLGTVNGGKFLAHTNRLSGVINVEYSVANSTDGADGRLPHYETAVSVGQVVMYLVYQTDGIQNNAPIMGNFTSILIEDQLESYNTILQSIRTEVNNSITLTATGDPMNPYINVSNLTLAQVNAIYANTSNLDTLLYVRRTSDEQFYEKSKQITSEYKALRGFSNMGLTANNLNQNFIGTDKLKARINS